MSPAPLRASSPADAGAADPPEVVDRIDRVSEDDWRRLAPADDPLWTRAFFRAMETGSVGEAGFEYLLFRARGRVSAIVPAFRFERVSLVNNLDPRWQARLDSLRRPAPGLLTAAIYFCGHPLGGGAIPGLGRAGAPSGNEVLAALRARAAHHRLRWLLVKDLPAAELPELFPDPAGAGFFAVPSFPEAVLRLEGGDFDAWLAALRPKARRNARRNLRRFDAAGAYRIERRSEFAALVPRMTELYRQVFARARVKLDRLDAQFFAAVAAMPEPGRELVAAFEGERLVGFLLCLAEGDGGVVLRVGLDDAVPSESRLYFALHYEAIRAALERGCRRLNFCQASYPPKIEMGCRLEPRSHLATHTHPLVRPMLAATMPALMEAQIPAPRSAEPA